MENEEEIIDSTNNTENTENTSAEDNQEVAPQDDVESLKKTIATLEAQKEHWREKAQSNKAKATEPKPTSNSDLSGLDILTLSKANVDSEDVEEVVNWAKYKGVSVSEALKSNELNAILNVRKDMRVTANASNTGASRRQTGKLSDEALLNLARSGKMPESEEDLDRLVRLKTFGGRK